MSQCFSFETRNVTVGFPQLADISIMTLCAAVNVSSQSHTAKDPAEYALPSICNKWAEEPVRIHACFESSCLCGVAVGIPHHSFLLKKLLTSPVPLSASPGP